MNETNRIDPAPVERQNYYLISGEIVFQPKDAPEDALPNAIRINGVVVSSDGRFAVPQIGRAQQTLQMNFFARMGEENKPEILDVVILGIIPLGSFTAEEFNKPPSPIVGTEAPSEELVN